ncbi:MAG TPA: cupin domain-containing protein [Terriglobales bacterium]|jgi:quercetin dioxygenase-like cupin family protein
MAKQKRSKAASRVKVSKPKTLKSKIKTKAKVKAKKSAKKPALVMYKRKSHQYISWDTVETEEMNPLLKRQMITGDRVMLARLIMKKGCIVPLHSHHNEQVTHILQGALKFVIEGKEVIVRAGDVLTIPPHVPHSAEALEDTMDLDVFDPPREDWINKTDSYLRAVK